MSVIVVPRLKRNICPLIKVLLTNPPFRFYSVGDLDLTQYYDNYTCAYMYQDFINPMA